MKIFLMFLLCAPLSIASANTQQTIVFWGHDRYSQGFIESSKLIEELDGSRTLIINSYVLGKCAIRSNILQGNTIEQLNSILANGSEIVVICRVDKFPKTAYEIWPPAYITGSPEDLAAQAEYDAEPPEIATSASIQH